MSGLNPTVTGALIAGGFAVIAGALAAMNTRATMRATMRANRDEDRSQRYWEKKTALYEELYEAMDLGSALSDLEAHGLKDGVVHALTSLSNLESRTYLYATSGGVLPDFLSLVSELRKVLDDPSATDIPSVVMSKGKFVGLRDGGEPLTKVIPKNSWAFGPPTVMKLARS